MRKMKVIINENFGRFSRLILKITVPLVLVQAIYLMYYIFSRDAFTIFTSYEIVMNIVESVLMSLLLSVGGSLFMDFLERKKIK